MFEAWKALGAAHGDTGFLRPQTYLVGARQELANAIAWDKRQSEDHKLRLKALASQFFEPALHAHEDAECPLCESKLSGEKRKALAAELNHLKQASVAAERKLADVCAESRREFETRSPRESSAHFALLATMHPRDVFLKAAKERFANSPPFSTVLTGMGTFASETATKTVEKLPAFTHTTAPPQGEVPASAQNLAKYIGDVERVSALVGWWHTHGQQFVSAWNELRGIALEAGGFPAASLEGKLAALEAALEKATPLNDLAKALNDAAAEADKWLPIYKMQRVREAIAAALGPFKDLRLLVATETASSISSLSGRMKAVLDRIHFKERLSFEDATLSRKAVQVTASFDHGIQNRCVCRRQ